MKEFFKKIWAWVLSHKVLAGIIAGATVVVLTVAIVVPVSVSAARRRHQEEPPAHEHTYASGWTYDESYHWHSSTCGHNVTDAKAAHTENDYGFCNVCGVYLHGTEIPTTAGTSVSTGAHGVGEKFFERFSAYPHHQYQLTFDGWDGSELKVYYQSMMKNYKIS